MEEFRIVPIGQVVESSTNPRRNFKGMEELTESVRLHGVLVPLLVRPVNGRLDGQSKICLAIRCTEVPDFEIIAGARRYRAARAAGIAEIPVRVKELGDTEALELQVVENLQREDVHPLEEAIGYQSLLKRPGYDIAAIAGKIGRSESYVYQRLKLVDLIEPARDSFLTDDITAGHAILIARLQPKDQKEALEICFNSYRRDYSGKAYACGVRELSGWIRSNILLDLHAAPFKKDDPGVLAAAGPCTTCPKRTGFVPQLFPDIAGKDTCTNPACYQAKIQAYIGAKQAQLEAKGEKILRIKTEYSSNPKPGEPIPDNKWVQVTKKNPCDSSRKALVVDGQQKLGQVLEVCADPECKKHFRGGYQRCERDPKAVAKQKKEEEQRRREQELRRRILSAVLDAKQDGSRLSLGDLGLIGCGLVREMQSEDVKSVAGRHGLEPVKRQYGQGDYAGPLRAKILAAQIPAMEKLLIELSLQSELQVYSYGSPAPPELLLDTAKRYGVDAPAIEAKLDAELKEKKAKKGKAQKPKVQTSAKSKRSNKGKGA
jgi:ParB family chromosome partitioning protein